MGIVYFSWVFISNFRRKLKNINQESEQSLADGQYSVYKSIFLGHLKIYNFYYGSDIVNEKKKQLSHTMPVKRGPLKEQMFFFLLES